ncbi:MarR family transcriptional regulator [Sphingomonas sp. MG17]|jgi:DNA-binding MarR family transcriptional regulator|uniref:MarR family transcriptional regulator n=1 Tax=Sphingomonas tagetis TaxID=2949092 RepID=A0A9X2HHX5_9SPHN|nr:MarR family transcriptional regulator [Sphingomonas tagetis]MCP3729201.1 MarR family transcriptional regulator [Sphingomonas tagetis]
MSEPIGYLITDVSRLIRREFGARARQIGVTSAQLRTLSLLKREPGCNQGQIADILEVEPITVGRMIDRLEEAGLVERRRDPADRRVWRIHLTDAAQPLIVQLREIGDALTEHALTGLGSADREALDAMLARIRTNLLTDNINEAANG